MRFALFTNVENPEGRAAEALAETVATVVHAESLGFTQAWLTEHHFNRFSISASIFPLLAHLAARTRTIRLGAAAVLLPFHDPLRVAEDAATVDLLSGGRLMLGVARGGPFPEQFRLFGVSVDDSRSRFFESLDLVERLLGEEQVDHEGRWFHVAGATTQPRPLQRPLPIWIASLDPQAVQRADARGYGLMAGAAAAAASVREALRAGPHIGRVAIARWFLCEPDAEAAIAEATQFVRQFGANMGVRSRPGAGSDEVLQHALVGDPAAVARQLAALAEALPGVELTVLLKPATFSPARARAALTLLGHRPPEIGRAHV